MNVVLLPFSNVTFAFVTWLFTLVADPIAGAMGSVIGVTWAAAAADDFCTISGKCVAVKKSSWAN